MVHARTAQVSYLSQAPRANSVPLIGLEDPRNVQSVPYEEFSDSEMEVLSSQTGSACTGVSLTEGGTVCSTVDTQEDMSDYGQGISFSKNCKFQIVFATYPAFYSGYDMPEPEPQYHNSPDGRHDYFKGEWPAYGYLLDQTQPTTRYENGEMLPDVENGYHQAYAVTAAPNSGDRVAETTEQTEVPISPSVNGESVSVEGNAAIPAQECDCAPSGEVSCSCDSAATGDSLLETVEDEGTSGGFFLFEPRENQSISRPFVTESVCPVTEVVPRRFGCVNVTAGLLGWAFQIEGFFQNVSCQLRGDCYENVHIVVNTDSLLGTNNGCGEACGDVYLDAVTSNTKDPVDGRSCNDGEVGTNAPCYEDRYVETMGQCRICGRLIDCPFVWKNWLYDFWQQEKTQHGPCGPQLVESLPQEIRGRYDLSRTDGLWLDGYNLCHFDNEAGERGYFQYVIDHS